jgi:hypothetical protein
MQWYLAKFDADLLQYSTLPIAWLMSMTLMLSMMMMMMMIM